MGYPLLLHPRVRSDDVPVLGADFSLDEPTRLALRRRLVELLVEVEREPRCGRPMRRRPGYEILADCHSLPFDVASWRGKDRFRVVYKIDPGVEAIGRVLVYAVGSRPSLEAYRKARERRRAADWP